MSKSDSNKTDPAGGNYLAEQEQYLKEVRAKVMAELTEAETANKLQSQQSAHEALRRAFLYSLIRRRLSLHLTQAELARRLGVQQSVVARIEASKANPTLETLLKIADALDTTLTLQSARIVKSKQGTVWNEP